MRTLLPSIRVAVAGALLLVGGLGCGEESVEERVNRRLREAISEAAGADVDLDSLGESLRRAAENVNLDSVRFEGLGDVEVVPFRELKTLMPERIAGLARERHFGETKSMFGLRYSVAEAVYGSGERQVEASLTDAGGGGAVIRSLVGFTAFEVDKETAEGSERTFDLDGYRAYEKVRTRGGRTESSLTVLVDDRFVVSLRGEGVDAGALTAAFRDFDLAALPASATEDARE